MNMNESKYPSGYDQFKLQLKYKYHLTDEKIHYIIGLLYDHSNAYTESYSTVLLHYVPDYILTVFYSPINGFDIEADEMPF